MVLGGAFALCLAAGCSQNPYLAGPGAYPMPSTPMTPPVTGQAVNPADSQLAELNRRVQLLDDNNRQLHTQLAQSEQQAQVYREELDLVRRQLADTTRQLETASIAAREAQNTVRGFQASTQLRGGASIQPNTNLNQLASRLNLGGLPVRQDGDRVRIAIPSDQLFAPGTAQLIPQAAQVLDPVAAQLRSVFPRQRIGIEGYTDNAQAFAGGAAASHQLASAQASAVLDLLTRRAGMPLGQFFIVAQGANQPAQSNASAAGRAANRRIELVIYPETF
ncbi:OmpA family protein [Roseiconus nitratireducens]|uniref:OmpA family protein n=1 Tax=Roseiconus nitratireducens TaxID=2605748 RepID=A0A5M6D3A0_9BACT|nr:OmpA family protein [Roseiconus nitratireducens]KAA5541964.1 OmpA family protein [Roseiconus nitratireducens]